MAPPLLTKERDMFTMEKSRLFIFAFLAFCVLSSKHILIYNEETLVALSFFLFVFFVFRYFGDTIRDSLQERAQLIEQELQQVLHLKDTGLQTLLEQHHKVAGLVKAMTTLDNWTTCELASLDGVSQQALRNRFRDQIHARLNTVVFSKMMLQQRLQHLLAENVLSNVLSRFQSVKRDTAATGARQHQAIRGAIDLLVADSR